MGELLNDICCLTCKNAEYQNEDDYGNPEYITCKLSNENVSIDDYCKKYTE